MDASNYAAIAKRYAEQVVAGEILACQWVQRACQRQLDDLLKFKSKAILAHIKRNNNCIY